MAKKRHHTFWRSKAKNTRYGLHPSVLQRQRKIQNVNIVNQLLCYISLAYHFSNMIHLLTKVSQLTLNLLKQYEKNISGVQHFQFQNQFFELEFLHFAQRQHVFCYKIRNICAHYIFAIFLMLFIWPQEKTHLIVVLVARQPC